MATHSSILAWEIPRTEEPGGLPSMGSRRSWVQLSNWACSYHCFKGISSPFLPFPFGSPMTEMFAYLMVSHNSHTFFHPFFFFPFCSFSCLISNDLSVSLHVHWHPGYLQNLVPCSCRTRVLISLLAVSRGCSQLREAAYIPQLTVHFFHL